MGGILPLWKERHDDCDMKLENIENEKESGILVLLILRWMASCNLYPSKSDWVVENLHEANKSYQGEITLEATLLEQRMLMEKLFQQHLSKLLFSSRVIKKCKSFYWKVTQIPPMYSAVESERKTSL